MKLNLIKLFVVIIIATFSCTSPQTENGSNDNEKSTEVSKVSDFFPSKLITKVFSGGFENEGMKHTVLSIEGNIVQMLQEDTGTNLILVYEVTDDFVKIIFSEAEYYSTEKLDEVIPNRNQFILKAPIETGNKWEAEHGGFYEITATNLEVTTPAGTFTAVETTFNYDQYQTKYYFAKNLGIIKTVSDMFVTELLEVR